MLSAEEITAILEETGAIQMGHFLLSSGLHSPVYIQCALVFQHPRQAERLGVELAGRFARERVRRSPGLSGSGPFLPSGNRGPCA